MSVLEAFHPFPKPLVRIGVATVAVFGICLYISGLQDQFAPPGTMSSTAIAQRVQPLSQVQLATTGTAVPARN